MKTTTRKISLLLVLGTTSYMTYSQTPTGSPPANNTNSQAQFAWYRGGNFQNGSNNNIFGTAAGFNSPIFVQTDGGNRLMFSHLAAGAQLQVYSGSLLNPLPGNRLTRIGISRDGNQPVTKPLSLLHLGYNSPVSGIAAGHRSWQDIGTMYMAETDNFYVGLRQKNSADPKGRMSSVLATPNDAQDAVISWGDNYTNNGPAPDNNLTFIFHAPLNPAFGYAGSDYGREVMRINGDGNVGIGPVFYDNAKMQNMLHINNDLTNPAYVQISNQNATGQTANDGFHLGITTTGIAELKQKENLDMRFFTNNTQQAVIKNTGWIGFNTNTPGNELEIRSRVGTPYGLSGSGLRFTNMKSTNATIPNPGTGVLSVDTNGDVIYVPGGGGLTTGNNGVTVTAGAAQLGVPCSIANIPAIVANQFTTDRIIANRNQNLWIASLNNETGGMGVGGQPVLPFCNLGNTFEISANSKNTQYGTAGSGLRFTKLTSSSATIPNGTNGVNNTKVLTVDGDGDVVLTDANPGGSSIGNICGATANPLTNNWEIPLNNNNFVFTGQGTTNNGVGIGTNCSPVAKLDVLEASGNSNSIGINVVNTDVYATGINVDAQGPGITAVARNYNQFTGNTIGVSGIANNFNSFKANIGVYGEAKNNLANENTGGFFNAATPGVLSNIGVIGYANNARNYNAGGIFHAISSVAGATENKGIETLAWGPSTMPNVALHAFVDPARPQDFAGIFDGAVQINGATTVNGSFTSSDQMFKTNIDTINNALNIINSLKPKQYYYDTVNVYGMRFSSKKQYGLIAQEVEQVLPEMVSNAYQKAQLDTAGHTISQATDYKTVNYNALFGIMVKAIQEQQRTIEVYKQKDSIQNARLTALENAINQCCSNNSARTNNSTTNQLDVELSDKDAIVLNQNVPNPFAEQTTITYNVPVSVTKAQIIFYNGAGQIIQTVDITTRGKGKVNVFANDLSSGLYHYTLVADGKVVDSKKMVRE